MNSFKFHFILLAVLILLGSFIMCVNDNESKVNKTVNQNVASDSIVKVGNKTTTISTDVEELGRILNFKEYKPTKVKFKYTYIDNSGSDELLSVPGPSDYYLEAILYFDSLTFSRILAFDKHADFAAPNYNVQTFQFDWLDTNVLQELTHSTKSNTGHPDFFFRKGNTKCWYLDRKILLYSSSL
jgi:hypothetical protein